MRDLTPDEILWCEWVQTLPEPEIARHEQATGLSLGGFQAGLAAGRAQVRREFLTWLEDHPRMGVRELLDRLCPGEAP